MKDIIEKIKKLRELSNSSNVNEAAAAASAADKLIAKFRISEQELHGASAEEIVDDTDVLYKSGRAIGWKTSLAIKLAEHYSCFVYNSYDKNVRKQTELHLAGVKSDIEIVKYMFAWLVCEIENLNKANKGLGHIACNSFCLGAVCGIVDQLEKSKVETTQDAINNGQEKSIQLINQRVKEAKDLVASYCKDGKMETDKSVSKNHIDNGSFRSGRAAGNNIHLGKSMGPGAPKLLNS